MNYELKIPIGRFGYQVIVYLCRKICENGLRLGNSSKLDCTRLAPSLQVEMMNDYEEDRMDTDDHRHDGRLQ